MNTKRFYSIIFSLLIVASILSACGGGDTSSPEDASGNNQPQVSSPNNNPGSSSPSVELPITVPGPGSEFFVDPAGSDSNDGSQAAPWQTIQHAVDSVSPGDTILVQSGTYQGARIEQSGTSDAWIILKAAPDANVLVNSPGPNNRHDSILEIETWEGDETVSFWVINGLEVADAPNWGIDVRGNESNHSHHFIVQNNFVHNNGIDEGKTGIFFAFIDDVVVQGNESFGNGEHGIYLSNSGDRFIVRGNRLHNNVNCGLHINGDLESGEDGIISDGLVENNIIYENGKEGCSGINMDGVDTAIIRNNLLYENHAGGISLFQENGAICTQNVQILNNTIMQAEDGRWAINISDDDCVNNKIFNNIILTRHEWRGSILIPSSGISGFESDHNIVMDRFSPDDDNSVISLSEWQSLGFDVNSIVSIHDVVFDASNDFRLISGSPAIDTGLILTDLESDMEGTSRPQGVGIDIGAYEFTGSTSSSLPESVPPDESSQTTSTGGTITYTLNDQVFRLDAKEGSAPQNISQALDQLSPGRGDRWLNISPDGEWLILETERFNPECVEWACIAIVNADLSKGEAIIANGELVHTEGFGAVSSGGNLVVFPFGDGPHQVDLWAVNRKDETWEGPFLLTSESSHEFNHQPSISNDGSKVVFNCGQESYAGKGSSICEVNMNGTDFRVVLTPTNSPTGFPTTGALHNPDYAPDNSIVFEGDWGSEQVWRLPPNGSEPVLVVSNFSNDNSPCVLPDGRIVSLWLDRSGGRGFHELKIMTPDGQSFFMPLQNEDIIDIGIGCGT